MRTSAHLRLGATVQDRGPRWLWRGGYRGVSSRGRGYAVTTTTAQYTGQQSMARGRRGWLSRGAYYRGAGAVDFRGLSLLLLMHWLKFMPFTS